MPARSPAPLPPAWWSGSWDWGGLTLAWLTAGTDTSLESGNLGSRCRRFPKSRRLKSAAIVPVAPGSSGPLRTLPRVSQDILQRSIECRVQLHCFLERAVIVVQPHPVNDLFGLGIRVGKLISSACCNSLDSRSPRVISSLRSMSRLNIDFTRRIMS